MTIGPLHIQQAIWLIVPVLALPLLWWRPLHRDLPGAWARSIEPALQPLLARWLPKVGRDRRALLQIALFTLLGLALAGLGMGSTLVRPERALHGRMLVIDAGQADSVESIAFVARRLITESPGVPTGVIVLAGDAYDVVPLTADPAQLDRYLRVLNPGMMPMPGRRLDLGVSRAMAALERSRIPAGQIVVVTAGAAPDNLPTLPSLAKRLWILTTDDPDPSWRPWADHLDARVIDADQTPSLNEAIDSALEQALVDATPVSQRLGLTPWLVALSLPLWLLLFFRREGA